MGDVMGLGLKGVVGGLSFLTNQITDLANLDGDDDEGKKPKAKKKTMLNDANIDD